EVVSAVLERHQSHAVERRCHADRHRPALVARQGRRHLWQYPEPDQRAVPGPGLYADIVRGIDSEHDGHPAARDAADRRCRLESEVLMRPLLAPAAALAAL